MKEWTNHDLVEYISTYRDNQRENVLKQLLENDLLAKFLGTTNGRLILNSVVDQITASTMSIVRMTIENYPVNKDLISQAAQQINAAYNFMYSIAKMAQEGMEHAEKMKKNG